MNNLTTSKCNIKLLIQPRKAFTRGRTDHFVTYLQFTVKVFFPTAETELLFSIHFHKKEEHFSPLILSFGL